MGGGKDLRVEDGTGTRPVGYPCASHSSRTPILRFPVCTPGPRQGFPYLAPVWGIWCHDQDNNRLRRAPKTRVRDVLLRQTLLGISGTFPLATNTARRWAVMDPYS